MVSVDLSDDDIRDSDVAPRWFVVADGTRLPFPPGSFDGVLCSNMLEHTPTPMLILDEIERVRALAGGVG